MFLELLLNFTQYFFLNSSLSSLFIEWLTEPGLAEKGEIVVEVIKE